MMLVDAIADLASLRWSDSATFLWGGFLQLADRLRVEVEIVASAQEARRAPRLESLTHGAPGYAVVPLVELPFLGDPAMAELSQF